MTYRSVENLHSSLQPDKLVERELAQFDDLTPEIVAQFEQMGDTARVREWIKYHRELVQNQLYPLHAFLELVVQHVEHNQLPQVLPED